MDKKKILIIDDEPIIREACTRVLEDNYDVETADCAIEGIKKLDKTNYDLVLLDIKMPKLDGFEALQLIKNQWPDLKVLIVTGYSTEENAIKAVKEGAFGFLEKPFNPSLLLKVVENALKGIKI